MVLTITNAARRLCAVITESFTSRGLEQHSVHVLIFFYVAACFCSFFFILTTFIFINFPDNCFLPQFGSDSFCFPPLLLNEEESRVRH